VLIFSKDKLVPVPRNIMVISMSLSCMIIERLMIR